VRDADPPLSGQPEYHPGRTRQHTRVTELVYRKELRPVLTRGVRAMDALFPDG
jgi:hypothetical protein